MPYVNIKITKDGASLEQKATLIKGVKMDLLKRSGDKRTSVYCFKSIQN